MRMFKCANCGAEEPVTTRKMCCPKCGGLFDLEYDVPPFTLSRIKKNVWNIFRYQDFLPLLPLEEANFSLGEGLTPIVDFGGGALLKMDYEMPTLSFKDRGAAVLMAHCKQIGIESVVQDSSGNAGNSVAAYCARVGIKCEIFVPEGTKSRKIKMIEAHGATCTVVPGSRDYCADVCREKAAKEGIYYANHVYNPFFYQGTKTYIYEAYEQLGTLPQVIFLPLGNGTLFIGAILALRELLKSGCIEKMPHLIAVQSERCAPFFKAAAAHAAEVAFVEAQKTMAEGIAIGRPMRAAQILKMIYEYDAEVIAVPEEDILPAREKLAKSGIFCEHTTAANYAAYEIYRKRGGMAATFLIPMCGAGLKSEA